MRPYYRLLVSLTFVLSLLFTACRNAPEVEQEAWDKSVSVRLPSDPKVMHFLQATDSESTQVLYQIFMPLVNFHPETYEMLPVLIETLPKVTEITEGPDAGLVSYEYDIREEAIWADGSPVTGKDYLFTIKAMFNPHKMSPYASQFRKLNRIEVDKSNPKKFTIYTSPYMMALASYSNFNPIPAYLYDPEGTLDQYSLADLMEKDKLKDKADLKALADYMYSPDALTTPQFLQGSGPYQLEKWETGRELVLTKRSNWWGDKVTNGNRMLKAVPEQIVYKVIPDVNAAISLMNNNELDVFAKMNWTTFLNQKDKAEFASNHQFHTPDLFGLRMMYINTAKDKLADKRVRRAIAHLMDKEELFNTVFYGYPTATSQLASPAKASYNPDLPEITYDVEKAKTLLKEAGWEDSDGNGIVDKEIAGERVELTLDLSFAIANKDYESMATLFQASAKKGGVNLVLQGYEGGAFIAQVKSKEYDLAFLGTSDYPFNLDPAMKWATVGPLNYSGFGTPESDDIIRAIRKTADIDKQNELFRELNAIIYDQQPALFICVDKDRIITNKAFGNVATSGLSPGFLINEFDGNSLVEAPINSSNN